MQLKDVAVLGGNMMDFNRITSKMYDVHLVVHLNLENH